MTFTAAQLCKQYQNALLSLSAKSPPEREISQVFCTNDKYEVKLDIQNFQPEEVSVRAVDRFIMVEGKHEQRGEQLGLISHQFTRRYVLPDGVLPEDIECSLGSDGILRLSAPRHMKEMPAKEVLIPIIHKDDNNTVKSTIVDVTSPQKERPCYSAANNPTSSLKSEQ